jgi:transposase
MRLTEYARHPQKRKAYGQEPGLWLVGVDVSQAQHHACIGTQTGITYRKLALTPSREGCRLFAQTLRNHLVNNSCRHLLSAMAPSGLSGQGLSDRLRSCGYDVCLVSCQAVRHNRKTMQEATRKTDATAAYRVLDWLRQGKLFLPVARDAALQAAYRLMHRSMAWNKRSRPLRHPRRAAIPLTFPAFHPMLKDLTQPPA